MICIFPITQWYIYNLRTDKLKMCVRKNLFISMHYNNMRQLILFLINLIFRISFQILTQLNHIYLLLFYLINSNIVI